MSTPKHCPGFDGLKTLSSFFCKCPECGTEREIFSDEFEKEHFCKSCGNKIDFMKCELTGEAGVYEQGH